MEISHLYSLNTLKQTFDIKTLDDIIPITISFDPNRYIPSGAPGIIDKNVLFDTSFPKGRLVSVLFPFPSRTNIAPGIHVKIHSKNIYQLPQKNLIVGHKVKIIDTFDNSKLSKIREFVNDNAAITFTLFDVTSATDFFANIPNLYSRYKYSTFFYHYGDIPTGHMINADDVFVSFVSFIDINYCIPIFDHRKVDGMGVYCGFMYNNKNGKNAVLIDVLCFVLSNHRENLFYTDGARVATKSKISTNVLKYMIERIKLKSKCKMGKTVTDKIKKVEGSDHNIRCSMPTFNTSSNISSSVYTTSGSWS